jgi:hypothetical protein
LTANIEVQFRACIRGETIFNGIIDIDTIADIAIIIILCNHIDLGASMFCDACSEGTYSLVDMVDKKTTCKYCGNRKEIETCSADQIKLNKGILFFIDL